MLRRMKEDVANIAKNKGASNEMMVRLESCRYDPVP